MFKNKVLMITGGTGSFGNAVLNRFFTETILAKLEYFLVMKKSRMLCVTN
jgi:UDP-N-acetylglucosamine 4,6-dehydratase